MKFLAPTLCLAIALLFCGAESEAQDLLLFGGENHDDFLGCLRCNKFSSESVCNPLGEYGNQLGAGIWNLLSWPYGNEFSFASPWNQVTTSNTVPIVIDRAGNSYGYFTTNDGRPDAVDFASHMKELFNRFLGDRYELRIAVCDLMN